MTEKTSSKSNIAETSWKLIIRFYACSFNFFMENAILLYFLLCENIICKAKINYDTNGVPTGVSPFSESRNAVSPLVFDRFVYGKTTIHHQ